MNQDLGHGIIRIWRIALTDPPRESHRACLDESERRRADAFRFDRDRYRFIRSHAALRRLLSSLCDLTPEQLSLQEDARGKPILPPAYGLHFNLSHSENRALLAVSRIAPLGVDLEKIRPLTDAGDLAARHFSSRECAYLRTLPSGAQRTRAFFRCWTRKEAFVKCTGVGLRTDLQRIEAGFDGDAVVDGVLIRSLPIAEDFAAAIATEGPAIAVETLDYRDPPA